MSVKKCVMTIAGMGTGMLPITKTVTKEMLPVINTPILFYQVKEAYMSGIKEIIFVVSKKNIDLVKSFFSSNNNLDKFIADKKEKAILLKELNEIIKNVEFKYILQKEKGTFGALYSARKLLNNEFFAVCFPDDLVFSDKPLLKQLIDEHKRTNDMVIAVKETDYEDLPNYGIIQYGSENIMQDLVYKDEVPLPSLDVLHGRFILHTKIFNVKNSLHKRSNDELQLPEALLHFKGVRCVSFKGAYFDVGKPLGYMKANIYASCNNDMFKDNIKNFIKKEIIK